MLIINAVVHTMEGKAFPNGFVKITNGKIEDVGDMKDLKGQDGEVLDAKGKDLYPGFIDAHTHLGMWEDSISIESDDGNEDTDPATPQMRAIDASNPIDRAFEEALLSGITCVMIVPGSANPIGGQGLILKTVGRCIDDMVVRQPAAMKFALGENPKMVYRGKNQTPVTRMATAAIIREQFLKTISYSTAKAEATIEGESIEYDFKAESLLPVLNDKLPAHFHAHRMDDIFTAIRIAKEFELDYVLVHCTDGHLIAKELKEKNVRAIIGPALNDRSKPELRNLSFETAGVLAKNGVLVAVTTDHPETPIAYLPLCAMLCARDGMDREEAIKAITINPAKILKIDDKKGSIKVGKDADLVLLDGDFFDIFTKPKHVFLEGRWVIKDGERSADC